MQVTAEEEPKNGGRQLSQECVIKIAPIINVTIKEKYDYIIALHIAFFILNAENCEIYCKQNIMSIFNG